MDAVLATIGDARKTPNWTTPRSTEKVDLLYQFSRSSNAAQAVASAKIILMPLVCLIAWVHWIHVIGKDKQHLHGEGVVHCLLSEKERFSNPTWTQYNLEKKYLNKIEKIRQHPVIWTLKRCCLNPSVYGTTLKSGIKHHRGLSTRHYH